MKLHLALSFTLLTPALSFTPLFGAPRNPTTLDARKPFIAGNWKMNPTTVDEVSTLGSGIASAFTSSTPAEVALFVPACFVPAAMEAVGSSGIKIGAEYCYHEEKGAYTGAISADMIKSLGSEWALAGHSERRVLFGESDEDINKQVLNLLGKGMGVILCIGESESDYKKGLVGPVCSTQLKRNLAGVSASDMSNVVIAYEPVWAIGTGLTCPANEAQDVHKTCRDVLADLYGQEVADTVRIQYGGSVSPETVDELMSKPDIDGALVGGASLDAGKFGRIINFQ